MLRHDTTLPQTFDTTLIFVRIPEGKNAATALDGELGIDANRLFPRLSAKVSQAKVAIA